MQGTFTKNAQDTELSFDIKKAEREAVQNYGVEEFFPEEAKRFRKAKTIHGTAQDFLHYAISFKENDDGVTACEILKRGLDFYQNNLELLAYYLRCAVNSGIMKEIETECEKRYRKIKENPLNFYSEDIFMAILEYLHNEKTRNGSQDKKIQSEIEEILDAFYRKFPDREGCYFAHVEYGFAEKADNEKKIKLKEAVNKLPSCPRCALKLADMLCEEGKYEDACDAIDKCLRSVQSFPKINKAFAYYLKGVCKYGVFQNQNLEVKDRGKWEKTIINEIYEAFKFACSGPYANDLRRVHQKEIEGIVYILEKQTEIVFQ